METNKDAKVVSKKKQNIMYSEVKAISHIGKKKYGTDDFETYSLRQRLYLGQSLIHANRTPWVQSGS